MSLSGSQAKKGYALEASGRVVEKLDFVITDICPRCSHKQRLKWQLRQGWVLQDVAPFQS